MGTKCLNAHYIGIFICPPVFGFVPWKRQTGDKIVSKPCVWGILFVPYLLKRGQNTGNQSPAGLKNP